MCVRGCDSYSINRIRDQFIDRLVNDEYTRHGYYTAKNNAFDRIESVFNEPSDNALNALLNNFWNGWADVANNPDSAGARETLRSTAESLTAQFNYISTQLRTYKDTINDEIEARVNTINNLTAAIHQCNKVITGSEGALGNNANDTRDQRDLLLNELAKLIDVDYFEDDLGALVINTNGQMLVSPATSHELMMRRTELTEQDGYQYSRVEVSFALTGTPFNPKQGELRALMDIRDQDIPKYEEYINSLAKTLITEVNKIHQNGFALNGLTFIDFFDSDPRNLNAANIRVGQAIKNDINNIAAGSGGQKGRVSNIEVDRQEIEGHYTLPAINPADENNAKERSLNLFGHGNLEIYDSATMVQLVEGTDYFIDTNGVVTFHSNVDGPITVNSTYNRSEYVVPQLSPGETATLNLTDFDPRYREIFKDSVKITTTDATGKETELQEGKDFDVNYVTGEITFKYSSKNAFTRLSGTPVKISFDFHKSGEAGPGDGDNALALYQLRGDALMQSDVFGKSTQTINEFYAGMLGRLGVERNQAESGLETRTFALQQLQTSQDETMGVNLDEEVANLIQYQHTYQASARYLSTINTMLDVLLNM